jgi:hypothetical protein
VGKRLRGDPRLRDQLAAAHHNRIPLSEWRSWSEDDQDAALAWLGYLAEQRAATCSGCGTRRDEWINPKTKRRYRNPPYVAEIVECPGCAECEAAEATLKGDPHRRSKHVVLKPYVETGPDDDLHPEAVGR